MMEHGIQFDPVEHKYTRKGKVYTSCTTVIEEVKKPFNRRYWAMYSTLKESFGLRVRQDEDHGIIYVNQTAMTLDELYAVEMYRIGCTQLKNGWDDITNSACSRGNKIHDYLEDTVNTSKGLDNKLSAYNVGASNDSIIPLTGKNVEVFNTIHDLDATNLKEVYIEIYDVLSYYINKGCTIYAEKKVYIDKYEVSGMIDCLIVKGKNFIILDWKTNKDIIHFKSGYYKKENIGGKWVKGTKWLEKSKYLLYPLNHLEECKGNIYTLQLSLYAYMFESWGYKLLDNGLFIFHMRPNRRPKMIPINYLRDEVIKMLEAR